MIKGMNGYAKDYYDNGKLKFEGEYLNGKRNGKAKEFYHNGFLKFEGEYLNDERNGKAKEYYDNGNLIYEGEYLKGKKKGRAKVYNYDGLLRIGKINNELEYKIENFHDNHEIYVPHNDKIIEYERRYLNGKGKEYYSKFTYDDHQILKFEGEYLNGKRNGKGKEYDDNGNLKFEGEYLDCNKIVGTEYN